MDGREENWTKQRHALQQEGVPQPITHLLYEARGERPEFA
jgi:hypothetical protein